MPLNRQPTYDDEDDGGYESETEEDKAQQIILDLARELDFTDDNAVQIFEKSVRFTSAHCKTLLHTLASLKEPEFYDTNGHDLLGLLLERHPSLLLERSRDSKRQLPLHIAIEKKRHHFLECFLGRTYGENNKTIINEVLSDTESGSYKWNCLHMAIYHGLPCCERLIAKCPPAALKQQDHYGHTPLHLVMEKQRKTWPSTKKLSERVDSLPAVSNTSKPRQKNNWTKPDTALSSLKSGSEKGDHQSPTVKSSNAALGKPGYQSFTDKAEPDKNLIFDPVEILKLLHSTGPKDQLTAINKEGDSPYQVRVKKFTTSKETEKKFQKHIKNLIFEKLTEIPDVRRALYGTQGPEKELCLDMSDFNQSSHDFKRFVEQLTKGHAPSDLYFEETLFYVYLPDMNTFKKSCPHDGVRDLFTWLSEEKKVETIKNLNIPDNTTCPMSDELVEEAVINRFQIEKFDWRKLDINIDILTKSEHASKFTDITLYSSGNWSVLYHWASKEGLCMLPNLRSVRIEIMELNPIDDIKAHKLHNKRAIQYKSRLESAFEENDVSFGFEIIPDGKWEFPIHLGLDSDEPFIPNLKIRKLLMSCHTFLGNLDAERVTEPKLTKKFKDYRIKIAIIDNGADKIRSSLKENIAKGVSFVKADPENGDRILPWWMVADPHGTQMASLVKMMNPYCQLYIARVGKGRKDILPEDAAEAVKWAVEQRVDIISISWITKKNDDLLRTEIEKAAKGNEALKINPILVFCSTSDEGVYAGDVYPACYDDTIEVAATDKYGHIRPASQAGVDILVPGEDVAADGPSYMAQFSKGTVSGSSVATALASGVASLALLLLRIFNEGKTTPNDYLTKKKMMEVFDAMNGSHNGIQLDKMFPTDLAKLAKIWKGPNFAEAKA